MEQVIGVKQEYEDPDKPLLVTGYSIVNARFSEAQDMYTELFSDHEYHLVIDLAGDDDISANFYGGSFKSIVEHKYGRVAINPDRSYYYIKFNLFWESEHHNATTGEIMFHEIIGHGHDDMTGHLQSGKVNNRADEKRARNRTNKLYIYQLWIILIDHYFIR